MTREEAIIESASALVFMQIQQLGQIRQEVLDTVQDPNDAKSILVTVDFMSQEARSFFNEIRDFRNPSKPQKISTELFNGLACPDCGRAQFETVHGAVCANGHGGVEGVKSAQYASFKGKRRRKAHR
jgi:hypothetical protein